MALILPDMAPAIIRPAPKLDLPRRGLIFPPMVGVGLSAPPPAGLGLTSHGFSKTGVAASETTKTTTSVSFTPADGSLLVALVTYQRGNNSSTVTISGGGLSWTQRAKAGPSGGYDTSAQIYSAPVATGASMTVTAQFAPTGEAAEGALVVLEFTGQHASPIGLSATGAGSSGRSGAYSLSLGGTAGATSIVVACGVTDDGTLTVGSGWTTDASGAMGLYSGSPYLHYMFEHIQSAVSSAAFAAMTTSYSWAAAALEIKAA